MTTTPPDQKSPEEMIQCQVCLTHVYWLEAILLETKTKGWMTMCSPPDGVSPCAIAAAEWFGRGPSAQRPKDGETTKS